MRRRHWLDDLPDLSEDQKPEIFRIEGRMVEMIKTGEYIEHAEVRKAYDWGIQPNRLG